MNCCLKILILAGTLATLSVTSVPVLAHSAHYTKAARSAQSSYDFRVATMNIYKWYLSPMGAMTKGKVDFNKQAFLEYANGLLLVSKLDLIDGFPKESGEKQIEDSVAKELVWGKPKEFSKAFKDFQREAQKLVDTAKKSKEKAIKNQFKRTSKTCSACHKQFRSKK